MLQCFAPPEEYALQGRNQYSVTFAPWNNNYTRLAHILDNIANNMYMSIEEEDIFYLREAFNGTLPFSFSFVFFGVFVHMFNGTTHTYLPFLLLFYINNRSKEERTENRTKMEDKPQQQKQLYRTGYWLHPPTYRLIYLG